jgi:hypothetical protein
MINLGYTDTLHNIYASLDWAEKQKEPDRTKLLKEMIAIGLKETDPNTLPERLERADGEPSGLERIRKMREEITETTKKSIRARSEAPTETYIWKLKRAYQSFKLWLCQKTGHSFSDVSQLIFLIKTNETNNDMEATITCRRCGQVFVHKDSPLAEGNQNG